MLKSILDLETLKTEVEIERWGKMSVTLQILRLRAKVAVLNIMGDTRAIYNQLLLLIFQSCTERIGGGPVKSTQVTFDLSAGNAHVFLFFLITRDF